MTPNESLLQGVSDVVPSQAQLFLGEQTLSAYVVLGEMFDNALDAGATIAWAVVEPGKLSVIDNGSGMGLKMHPEALEYLEMLKSDIREGRVRERPDLRQILSKEHPSSLRTIQWMMEGGAYSAKVTGRELTQLRGRRGIGAMSFRSIASEARWFTLPSPELFLSLNPGLPLSRRQVYRLTPPTSDSLIRFDARFDARAIADPLLDPFGKPLASGTRVEIAEIREGVLEDLRIDTLTEKLQSLFGKSIREGKFKAIVVDRLSPRGRREPIVIEVPPASYPGILVFPKEPRDIRLKGGRHPFKIEVYYEHGAKRNKVMLRARGGDIRPLVELEGFRDHDWLKRGDLSGFIEFPPDVPESEAPWSSDKLSPLPGVIRNQWQNAVEGCVRNILAAIDEVDDRARQSQRRTTEAALAKSVLEAMKETNPFSHIKIGPTRKPRSEKDPGGPFTTERVIITVLNQHNRGTEGVKLELFHRGKVVDEAVTGTSGTVSFGRRDEGRYTIRMTTPRGVKPADSIVEQTFNLGDNRPGFRWVFKVIVPGAPIPQQGKMGKLVIICEPLKDLSPYATDMLEYGGIVRINTESEDYRRVEKEGKPLDLLVLMAQYISSAITEVFQRDEPPHVQLMYASMLFGRILQTIQKGKR